MRAPRVWLRIASSTWLAATCAMSPGCRRPDAGPALQIIGEAGRRTTDPVPASSPWFDGAQVAVTAVRGETVGLQVVHRGGGPVTLRLPPEIRTRSYTVEAYEVHRPSTALYGGSHGAGRYGDGLVATDAPASDPV
ncbi:MAG: hypothetical protein H7138_24505, partial [Myxococcales bacterium]|nr:hypothetical protein [Myxococcales bacterium]